MDKGAMQRSNSRGIENIQDMLMHGSSNTVSSGCERASKRPSVGRSTISNISSVLSRVTAVSNDDNAADISGVVHNVSMSSDASDDTIDVNDCIDCPIAATAKMVSTLYIKFTEFTSSVNMKLERMEGAMQSLSKDAINN